MVTTLIYSASPINVKGCCSINKELHLCALVGNEVMQAFDIFMGWKELIQKGEN